MAHYSVADFVRTLRTLAEEDNLLAEDLALHSDVPTADDINRTEEQLGCKLPAKLVELICSIDISGAQLGQIVFGMRPFPFADALIEQNLKVDDPAIFTDRNLLSIGLDVNWASPICVPRSGAKAAGNPPVYLLDHEKLDVVGPIYSDFLTCLRGQAFLCCMQGKDASEIRQGMREILGATLDGPAASYWEGYFQTL
jgi:hypothetical protein